MNHVHGVEVGVAGYGGRVKGRGHQFQTGVGQSLTQGPDAGRGYQQIADAIGAQQKQFAETRKVGANNVGHGCS